MTHSDDEDRLLRSVALRNATAIMRARQRAEDELLRAQEALRRSQEQLREEARLLELLNRTGSLLSSSLDLQVVVQAVTDAATELSGAEFGAFFHNVTDENGDALMLYTLSGAARESFDGFGNPRATALFGPTFRGEAPIRCDDVLTDPRYGTMGPHHGMPPGHLPVRSYLAVPVRSRSNQVLGGLFFGHSRPGVFTERTERLIVGIAGQAGIAVDNARLYEEAQRMSRVKDEFLATLSHELRTPLNAILGWARMLRRPAAQPKNLEKGLETIERNALAQARLIDELLDMSRIVAGRLRLDVQPVDPAAVVTEAVESLRPAVDGRGIALTTAFDEATGCVSGDPIRLQQVVWNILSNAVKFTPRNGHVHVRVAAADDAVEISVADDGIGIRPELLPLLFERFRQGDASTTRTQGGLGLGLSIVKNIVELHGGQVWVESEGEGRGTTVRVRMARLKAEG